MNIRVVPVSSLPVPGFPVLKEIPFHTTDRDLKIEPPTRNECLYSIIMMPTTQEGYNIDEAIQMYTLGESLLTAEKAGSTEFWADEQAYNQHILVKLETIRFPSWNKSMIDFVQSVRLCPVKTMPDSVK